MRSFDPYDKELTTNRRILNWQRVADQEVVSPYAIERANFVIEDLHLRDMLVARLTAWVLTDQICERRQTVTLEVPASWWQHLKADYGDRWYLRWLVKRKPAKHVTWSREVVFSENRMYSDYCALPEDRFGKPVIVETIDYSPWEIS